MFPTLSLIAILLLCPSAGLVPVHGQSTGDPLPAAITYLRAHAAEAQDWVALALVAAGESTNGISVSTSTEGEATDLSRRILALTAVGGDPRPLADALEAHVISGSVNGNLYINDDVFAILAFRAAGRPAHAEPLPTITEFIINTQLADGGWGVTTLSRSDVDSTAAALQALSSVGGADEAVSRGLAYIRAQQQSDGGLPFRLPFPTNSASTSWTVSTLAVLGIDATTWSRDGANPITALQTLQQPDGGFGWQTSDPASTVLLTSYAVIALSGRGFIVNTYVPPTDPPSDDEPRSGDEPPGDNDPPPSDPPTDEPPTVPPSDDEPASTSEEPPHHEDTEQKRHQEPVEQVAPRAPRPSRASPLPRVHAPQPSPASEEGEVSTSNTQALQDAPASFPDAPPTTPQIAGVMDIRPLRTSDQQATLGPYQNHNTTPWIMAGLGLLSVMLGDLFLHRARRRV